MDICFFSRRRKSKYRLLPARGLLLPARGFMSSGFQKAERAEPGKTNFLKLSIHAIYYEETHICFFH